MKRIKGLLLIVLFLPIMILNVNAEESCKWIINGEDIGIEANADGTAKVAKNKIDLILENYKSGAIKLECEDKYPTKAIMITLNGENTIDAEDVGIDVGKTELNFNGQGSLVVKAKKPLSNDEMESVFEVRGIPDSEAPPQKETKSNKMDTIIRAVGSATLVLILLISFFVARVVIKKKKGKQD